MKHILTLLLLAAFCRPIAAQELPLAVYPIRQAGGQLTADQLAVARNKVIGLVAVAGFASTDLGAPVGVVPELVLYEPRTVQTGTRNLTALEGELVLTVQQRDGGVVFGASRKKLTASGKDAAQAKSQLLAAIPTRDPGLQTFLLDLKPKIADYYAKNCALLLADAERKASTDDFAAALSVLMNIPGDAACRADADKLLETTYTQVRDRICQQQFLAAQSAAAVKDYAAAVAALRLIDPRSSCYAPALDLLPALRSQADADYNATLDALVEYWKSESAIEQRRFAIVREFLKDVF